MKLVHPLCPVVLPLYMGASRRLSEPIDPLGQPKVTAGRDHCFRTCPSVSTFQNLAKQNKAKAMFSTCYSMDLAEWITDDTRLVRLLCLQNLTKSTFSKISKELANEQKIKLDPTKFQLLEKQLLYMNREKKQT